MSKEKPKLTDLKLKSFVTSLNPGQMEQTKGGLLITIQGKKSNYEVRWTSIDTRIEESIAAAPAKKKK